MSDKTELHDAIREAADPMAVLDRIVGQSLVLVPHADGASLELRRDAETLEYLSAAGTLSDFVGLRLPLHQSLSGLAVLTGRVQRCDDGWDDPRVNAAAVRKTGLRSMLCVPLSETEGGVAVLKVSSVQPNAFTEDDVERLAILARFLNVAVSAASDLAQVTADVLSELAGQTAPDRPQGQEPVDVARFVANVMTPGLADQVEALASIQSMIENERLTIHLQPIVDLATSRVYSCEALSRFTEAGERSTEWWFGAASRVGLGERLEMLALRKAFDVIPQLPDSVRIAVNLSPRTLLSPGFAELFLDLPLDRITIELTEHQQVDDYPAVLEALGQLRAAGVRLSVDDAGQGYASLAHILRIKPDVIKLDRELVTGIDGDPVKQAMATALVSFAGSIHAWVVAEGIETLEEAECVKVLGVPLGQGYYFGPAMPPEQLVSLLATA